MLHVERLTTIEELKAIAEAWNALSCGMPFRRLDWLTAWWRHCRRTDDALFVLAVRDDGGQILALVPWYRANSLVQGSVLRWLGEEEIASDYVTVLVDDEHAESVAAAIASWLQSEGGGQWDALDLKGVDPSDRCLATLRERLARTSNRATEQPGFTCWRADLRDGWDAYLATLSSNRRWRLRKLVREYFDTGRAQIHRATNVAELEQTYGVLVELHQKRRQSLGQRGCFVSERFDRFHREMTRQLLDAGDLDLYWIELEGRAASAQYNFRAGDTTYLYQSGFNPEFADDRVGWLALVAGLRGAIEAGSRYFDFLRGDEPYKAQLGGQPLPSVDLRIAADRASSQLREQVWRGMSGSKRWARRHAKRALEFARGRKNPPRVAEKKKQALHITSNSHTETQTAEPPLVATASSKD